jgi:hypothetical protein
METTIRTKQYGGEIILPNLISEAGAKTYGPPCIVRLGVNGINRKTAKEILDTFLNTKFVTRYLKRTEKTATLENLLP